MKNLTIIGLRLFAIWAFLRAFLYLQFLPFYWSDSFDGQAVMSLGMLIVFFLFLVFAGVLFFKAPFLSTKIIDDSGSLNLEKIDYEKFASVLFAAIGLLIFFFGLEALFNSIGAIYNQRIILETGHKFRFTNPRLNG